ncbi:hypothetical protein JXB11_01505 [Candidatus Woesearchaeota archaeon]|nr:hypothetical protein [Candidatus Woesearchaeota archaeon]
MSVDELRERVYRIRALLHLYGECLDSPESSSYSARSELKIAREELLQLLIETRKRVKHFAGASAGKNF